ncbi:hypothetical protein BDW22DRAFT_667947 [Trametopsis cervina]|nr:hypothetical protein BDW22DRAFT_667947 [Trametopsis cervina]
MALFIVCAVESNPIHLFILHQVGPPTPWDVLVSVTDTFIIHSVQCAAHNGRCNQCCHRHLTSCVRADWVYPWTSVTMLRCFVVLCASKVWNVKHFVSHARGAHTPRPSTLHAPRLTSALYNIYILPMHRRARNNVNGGDDITASSP